MRTNKIRKLECEIREELRNQYIVVNPVSLHICRPDGLVLKGEKLTQAHEELEARVQSELQSKISEKAYQKYAKKYLAN